MNGRFTMYFAAELKRVREEAGLSQAELAEKAGVSRSYVAHLEQGIKENAELYKLYRILNVLAQKGALVK